MRIARASGVEKMQLPNEEAPGGHVTCAALVPRYQRPTWIKASLLVSILVHPVYRAMMIDRSDLEIPVGGREYRAARSVQDSGSPSLAVNDRDKITKGVGASRWSDLTTIVRQFARKLAESADAGERR